MRFVVDSPGGGGGASDRAVSSTAVHDAQRLSSADVAVDAADFDTDEGDAAHMHRLQRQDAKSRKTFKIKRNRSTLRASAAAVARSATVKVSE